MSSSILEKFYRPVARTVLHTFKCAAALHADAVDNSPRMPDVLETVAAQDGEFAKFQ